MKFSDALFHFQQLCQRLPFTVRLAQPQPSLLCNELKIEAIWTHSIVLKPYSDLGGILPAATLNVNNFSNIEANATKLGDFL